MTTQTDDTLLADIRSRPADHLRAALAALAVAAMVAAVVGAALFGAWTTSNRTVRDDFRTHLVTLAEAAAHSIDPELHEALRRPEQTDSAEYVRAVAQLKRLRDGVTGLQYVYTVRRAGEDLEFVLDAAEPGDHDGDGQEDRSRVGDKDTPLPAQWQALGLAGVPPGATATSEPFTDRWGTFMSGFAPIRDADGRVVALAGVDVDASVYLARLAAARQELVDGIVRAAGLAVLLSAGTYWACVSLLVGARRLRRGARDAKSAARRDRLTGLANRTAFMEHLEAAMRRVAAAEAPCFAVLFLDFDYFKTVNDTLGHEAGDELLRQIAARLRGAVGPEPTWRQPAGNVIARFGGDEFVVLLNDLAAPDAVAQRADELVRALAPSYTIRGTDVASSASIGVYVATGEQGHPENVIRNADVAMYEAKHSGRACWVLFDEGMRARVTRRVAIESGLLRAIGTPELSLRYQPIVELGTGRQVAAETLVHWCHPELGEVPPAEFLPIAESSGLIVPLGEWVLHETCAQLAEWRRLAPERAPEWVSVNLTRLEIALGARLLERIRSALAQSGVPAGSIAFEIPERVATDPRGGTPVTLGQLRALGVRLSMDGFSTGTSSLACLRGHAFDTVKITQASLCGLGSNRDAMALVHATMTLLENLGMASIAEGVENAAQLAILQSFGCRYAQGSLFSEPVSAQSLLTAWTPVAARPDAVEAALEA